MREPLQSGASNWHRLHVFLSVSRKNLKQTSAVVAKRNRELSNMKKVLFPVVILLMSSMTWAQNVEKKQKPNGEVSMALSAIRLASDLVKYGYAQQSALPLVEALQIMNENPTQPLTAKKEGVPVDTLKTDGKSCNVSLDYAAILASAKEFAEGDDTMLKLIASIEAAGQGSHRGAVNGPSRHYDVVNGECSDTYQVNFIANYLAEVAVSGDGDTDLDLYVYDSNGNLIASDTSYSDDCYVCWVPAWTGRFIIKIVNRGPVYNRYVIMTN